MSMAKKRSISHFILSSDEQNCSSDNDKHVAKRKKANIAPRIPFSAKSLNTSSSGGPSVKPTISISFSNRVKSSLCQGQENVKSPGEQDETLVVEPDEEVVKKEEDFVQESPVGLSRERDIFAQELSPSAFTELNLALKDGVENDSQLFEWLGVKGLLTPKLLHTFVKTSITSLHLTASIRAYCSHEKPTALMLQPLFEKEVYAELQCLNLSRCPLINDDVSLLRLLPNLRQLNLSDTGITTEAIHHVVCHRHKLEILDISSNQGINDDISVPLKALIKLSSVALAGTTLSMVGLRRLADECRARYLSIPSSCLDYLNSRHTQYAIEIPQNLVSNPKSVGALTLPLLKQNLDLHRKNNPQISVTGTKIELINRLIGILSKRLLDENVARLVIQ